MRELFTPSPSAATVTTDAAIQGLRGVGALLVLLNHFGQHFAERFPIAPLLQQMFFGLSHLSLGSSTFIVISAFYSYRAFQRDPSLPIKHFLKRRGRGVLPLYWFVLGLYVVLAVAWGNQTKVPHDWTAALGAIVSNALLLAPLLNRQPIITASWTLTYIVIGYLTIPLLASGLRHFRSGALRLALIVSLGVFSHLASPIYPPLFAYGDLLATGALLAELHQTARIRQGIVKVGDLGTVVAFSLYVAIRGAWAFDAQLPAALSRFFFCTGIGSCVASRHAEAGWINSLLQVPFMQNLGRISYSLYLTHGLPLNTINYLVFSVWRVYPEWLFWCLLVFSFAASICIAAVLDRCWRPMKRFFEDFRVRPRPADAYGNNVTRPAEEVLVLQRPNQNVR